MKINPFFFHKITAQLLIFLRLFDGMVHPSGTFRGASPEDLKAMVKASQALLSAIPIPDMDIEYNKIHLEGDVPSPFNPPQGCRFHTRCRYATEKCRVQVPELKDVGDRHFVACHLYDE